MSYVRLKHALSAIALASITAGDARHRRPPLLVAAMAAYARRLGVGDGEAVAADALARDVTADPDAVRRALVDSDLFADSEGGIALSPPYRPHAAYFRRQVARLVEALRLAARPAPADMPLELQRGVALFNAGLFFECHELLEDVWRESRPPARAFYHGLVQAAAGCYHAEKGNAHGAAVLLTKARDKLRPFAPRYFGVDVTALLASLDAVQDGAAPREAAVIAASRSA